MTSVRRYIFALVAVCVAFAAGIALGNGPLQGSTTTTDNVSMSKANAKLTEQLNALRQGQAFSEAIGKAAGPALLDGQLANVAVGIFVLPGVPTPRVNAVAKAVTAAGGEVTLRATLSATLVDPGKKTYVDSVATNSLKGRKDLASAAGTSTYARIGALIARAYTGTSDALAVDDEATGLDAQLQGAKLLTLSAPLARRASAVLVLASGDNGDADSVYAAHQIELQVVDALAGRCDGLLLAAPASASAAGGLVLEVTNSPAMTHAVSTLNIVDTPLGPIVAVGALAADIAGQPGTYGIKGGLPALPPVFTTGG